MSHAEIAPSVFVIILNYNGLEHLRYSLPSIMKTTYSNFSVLVVDNGSTDGSLEYLRSTFPEVKVIPLSRNRGWSAGNNVGIHHALEHGAEHIVLANNDILVDERWIENAVLAAAQDKVGLVGFHVIGALSKEPIELFNEAVQNWGGLEIEECAFIDGIAFFVPSTVFKTIGLLDEGFFLYGEDTDFCLRVTGFGYRIVRTNLPIWHFSQGTSSRRPLKSAYLAIRHDLRLALKHGGPLNFSKRAVRILLISCNPVFRGDMDNVLNKRMRPGNIITNFFIVAAALLWNLSLFFSTLRARRSLLELNRSGINRCAE